MTVEERDTLVKKANEIRLGSYYFKRASQWSRRDSYLSRLTQVGPDTDFELWYLIDQ